MSFYDIRFPVGISYGSRGGPAYNTSIIVVKSGQETRNINWAYPRSQYDIAYGIRDKDDLETLIDFFHVVQGRAYSFRYKDYFDYKSCHTNETVAFTDQVISTGDNTETEFQIYKYYQKTALDGSPTYTRTRKITKIVYDSLLVGIDGIQQPESEWTADETTGIITFDSPPGNGLSISCGFEFDVHARFDTDVLFVDLEDYLAARANVPIIEVK